MDRWKSYPKEHGQSLVEFALSLTILLILVVGIFDVARALFTYLSMRDAAQEGALFASIDPVNTPGIVQRTCTASSMLEGLDCEEKISVCDTRPSDNPCDLSIEVDITGQPCSGSTVEVSMDYPQFPLTMPLLGQIVGADEDYSIQISASVTDRIIIPSCSNP